MRFGIMMFPADRTMQPVEFGAAVEQRGFESVWFPEHSHIPTSRQSSFGGRPGGPPLPDYYWRSHEPFVALAAIAATTTTLRLGTGVTLVAQRDPIWLAKQVASLDTISGGRLTLGIGYGWNREEMLHHGVRYGERRAILREKVLVMKELWTRDEASFHGDHVDLSPSWAWPKPVSQPHPAIVMGAGPGPKTFAHIIEFCDGWMPNYGRYDLEGGISALRRAAADAARDPDTIELAVTSGPRDPGALAHLAELGVRRVLFTLTPGTDAVVVAQLDACAAVVERFGDPR
ncbi:MAG TPA: TIGR03619 family F420-dependent LLM class oxidoreductase [Acidimicrobiia bacterium]